MGEADLEAVGVWGRLGPLLTRSDDPTLAPKKNTLRNCEKNRSGSQFHYP